MPVPPFPVRLGKATCSKGAVQSGSEIQATFRELYRNPQPAFLENHKSVMHPEIVRVSYTSAGNQAWGVPFCCLLETCTKYKQSLYTFGRPPATSNRISAPILRPESARKHAPAAPRFLPIFDQKCNIPIGTFFCNIFPPCLPLFLSGQEPQNQKCYTFAENATPSRPLSRAPMHRRKTVPQPSK